MSFAVALRPDSFRSLSALRQLHLDRAAKPPRHTDIHLPARDAWLLCPLKKKTPPKRGLCRLKLTSVTYAFLASFRYASVLCLKRFPTRRPWRQRLPIGLENL